MIEGRKENAPAFVHFIVGPAVLPEVTQNISEALEEIGRQEEEGAQAAVVITALDETAYSQLSSWADDPRVIVRLAKKNGDGDFVNGRLSLTGALANAGRNTFPLKRVNNIDLALNKQFAITEQRKVEIGASAFNLFNHSNFGSYQTVVNVASYSSPVQNSDLAFAARMLQFAGRIEF